LPQQGWAHDDHHKIRKKAQDPINFPNQNQLLLFWLKNQIEKEAAEEKNDERVTQASADRSR